VLGGFVLLLSCVRGLAFGCLMSVAVLGLLWFRHLSPMCISRVRCVALRVVCVLLSLFRGGGLFFRLKKEDVSRSDFGEKRKKTLAGFDFCTCIYNSFQSINQLTFMPCESL